MKKSRSLATQCRQSPSRWFVGFVGFVGRDRCWRTIQVFIAVTAWVAVVAEVEALLVAARVPVGSVSATDQVHPASLGSAV